MGSSWDCRGKETLGRVRGHSDEQRPPMAFEDEMAVRSMHISAVPVDRVDTINI